MIEESTEPSDIGYKRILLKMRGESLMGRNGFGIDEEVLQRYAREVCSVAEQAAEVAIVIGGGNIFRGVTSATTGMTRAHADYMGMLATMINAMALQAALEQIRSEEHTSELQSRGHLVCRLLLGKKNATPQRCSA